MRVTYLSGGVGGARLLLGLAKVLPAGALRAIVNTGDDFTHWGLHVSPDLDTVMYTLAERSDFARGWGLRDERFHALQMVRSYGGEDWFQLGDRDLGTHLMRSQWLREGQRLTEVTARLCAGLGVSVPLLPMTDAPVQTTIDTADGRSLPFQRWFVQERTSPTATAATLRSLDPARPAQPSAEALDAIDWADLIVIGPSNPYVSIDPILDLPNVRARVMARPVLAVSPIVGGRAVKGPLAEMLRSIGGTDPTPGAIAGHYPGLRGIVVQHGDEAHAQPPQAPQGSPLPVRACETLMTTPGRSAALARAVLEFGRELCQ